MSNGDDFFTKMCKEAQQELASGNRSWKDIDTNTLFLAVCGILSDRVASSISKPLWFFASSVCAGITFYIVKQMLGIGS